MTIKYTLICEDDDTTYGPGRVISHTLTGEQTWDELLPYIESWLRGIGYIFNGTLDIVPDLPAPNSSKGKDV